MERANRLLVLGITAGSALLMLDLLKKQYPQQWAKLADAWSVGIDRAQRWRRFTSSPRWVQEMAIVRGLDPNSEVRS